MIPNSIRIVLRILDALLHWPLPRRQEPNPKLVMTLLVKNEAKRLEENLRFHHAMGVDHFIITDNNSTDGTTDIIRRYRELGWVVEYIEERHTNYDQKRWVDRMITLARKKWQATWVINADADELWYAPSGNLKHELAQCRGNVAHCQIRSMYPQADVPFCQWTWRVEFVDDQEGYGLSPYSIFQRQRGKVAHRTQGYIMIGMGNHKVHMLPHRQRECNIRIYHYNIQSRQEFVDKMVNGGQQMDKHPSKRHARHWRYFYKLYKEGRLQEEYDRVVGTQQRERLVKDGRLVEDTTIRDYFNLKNIATS